MSTSSHSILQGAHASLMGTSGARLTLSHTFTRSPHRNISRRAVIRMLISIGSPDKVPEFLERVKRKEAVLSGFGHRIYTVHDPRSKIIRK